jgi:hypothetical protein
MRTYDEQGGDYYRQMQIIISRWGDAKATNNAQYGMLPTYIPGNTIHFSAPAGSLTFSLRWQPGRATIQTSRGASPLTGIPAVSEHVFTSAVPVPGKETFDMMLFIAPSKNQLQHPTEVVVENFEYFPD